MSTSFQRIHKKNHFKTWLTHNLHCYAQSYPEYCKNLSNPVSYSKRCIILNPNLWWTVLSSDNGTWDLYQRCWHFVETGRQTDGLWPKKNKLVLLVAREQLFIFTLFRVRLWQPYASFVVPYSFSISTKIQEKRSTMKAGKQSRTWPLVNKGFVELPFKNVLWMTVCLPWNGKQRQPPNAAIALGKCDPTQWVSVCLTYTVPSETGISRMQS